MREKEDEENKRKLKEFQDLISESRIDIQPDQFIDEDERAKMEKVKKILEKKRNQME